MAIANRMPGSEQHVDDAHQHRVAPAAEEAGHQADGHAEQRGDGHRAGGRQQRGARAVDHARQHVAAELVGAEPVRALGPLSMFT